MPIMNREDAVEVEARIARIFGAPPGERGAAVRSLFVEALDFEPAAGLVDLGAAPANVALPASAERIASLEGVQVVYLALDTPDTDRVRKGEAAAAASRIADQLDGDLLLVVTNSSASQLHLVYPSFESIRPVLRRMVVERDLPRRTAVQQVSNIYWNSLERGGIRLALDRAFDVEPVTRQFFARYKRVFEEVENSVTGFGADAEARRRFVQTLFNRLMFIYFLSRKGWLAFKGNRDYLNALWRGYRAADGNDKNFYVDRLHPLFFAGLNNPQSRDLMRNNPVLYGLIGDVKFLNGGLFEKTDLDEREDIAVPDEAIEPILTDLFDRFNFTVMESTPFDVEVAVDPEMLGKVFEELVTGRHDSGAYYTPRPVVSFMCREALKGYLEGRDTGVSQEAIARFVDERDTSGISQLAAYSVAGALREVAVVDPACGSGAYLLGMMQELVELHVALFNAGVDPESLYKLKLNIIERNLYGVDVDDFAVNIAMLRLWLSLVIEYEGEVPPALPNLDFKTLCGDSLLGPDPGAESYGDLFRHRAESAAARLTELKAKYMDARSGKDALREKIEGVQDELREALADTPTPDDAIDWRVHFAEVFATRGGFDIAIANPPYVQLQGNEGLLANLYENTGYTTFARTGDIYQLFYERGCQALRPDNGLLAYITSNSWLKAEYGKATRRYLSESHTPLRYLELGKDVFESAIVDSGVMLLRTGGSGQAFPAVDMDRLADKEIPPPESLWGLVRPDGESPWSILLPSEQSALDKMQAVGTPIKDWDDRINYGIKTGYNKAFIIDEKVKNALIAADPKSAEVIRPILRGQDIQRYRANRVVRWLIDTHNGYRNIPAVDINRYPAVKAHLDQSYTQLEKRQDKGGTPYNLRSCAYYEEFANEKLIWMDLTERGRFAYNNGEMFCLNTAYVLTGSSIKYLCALLNSNLVTWYLNNTALNSGMGVPRWVRFTVERIPIPKISAEEQRPFVRLVDEILAAKDAEPAADTSALEAEIDRLVYDLYGLTETERAAVGG